jgi:4-amino-4-deoxy-L-arabinose transferase-like glycosyltransferase
MKQFITKKILQRRILLLLILILALIIRLFEISNNPPGFFSDEAAIGYNAYSILTTGKDEFGEPFPIFFRSFGDYRLPLSVYSAIPIVAFFDLNEFSIRFSSAVWGVITVWLVYLLGKEIDRKTGWLVGLLAGLVSATMPWLIHYNRSGFEFGIYAAFFTLTILLLFKSAKNNSYIIPAFVVSSATFYTYQPAKLLIPLLVLGYLIIYRKHLFQKSKRTKIGLMLFLLFGLPVFFSFFTGEGYARFNEVSVFSEELATTQVIFRVLFNYLTQLSPLYFITGENTFITRHFVGGLRPLLITTIPFFYIGLASVFLNIKRKRNQLLLYWVLIYPIAGAVTVGPPFTSRSIIGSSLSAILISAGIIYTVNKITSHTYKKLFTFSTVILFSLNLILFTRFYFIEYPKYSADFWGWQYGPKKIMNYFLNNKDNYTRMCIEPQFNAPEIFIKFYDPVNECGGKCQVCDISEYKQSEKQLFAITSDTYNNLDDLNLPGFVEHSIIYYPNGKEAFYLGEMTL